MVMSDESGQAAEARALVGRIVTALGVDADVGTHDEPEAIVVTCSGPKPTRGSSPDSRTP